MARGPGIDLPSGVMGADDQVPAAEASGLRSEQSGAVQRYRSLLETSTDGMWCYEFTPPIPASLPAREQAELMTKCRLVECNPACARYYGFSRPDEVIGRPITELVSATRDYLIELFERFVADGYATVDEEAIRQMPDGSERICLYRSHGVIENGKLLRAWGSLRDVTAQRQLERELRESQKLESVGRLAGGLAHDFNNLLTVIIMNGTRVLTESGLPSDAAQDVEEILDAAKRAAELTEQLLAYSQRKVLVPSPIDVGEIVSGLVSMLARMVGGDVRLATRLTDERTIIEFDRSQLERVIINLVANAREAMPQGGTLTLSTERYDPNATRALGLPDHAAEWVGLQVRDTGEGMSEEVATRIFEPFFTTKGDLGHGLGLATAYSVVHQGGGVIRVESTPGAGSCFKLLLPAFDGEPTPLESERFAPAPAPQPAKPATVLVVDDERLVRRSVVRALRTTPLRVLEASGGEEALDIAEREAAPVELLLTDVAMPGLSGPELAQRLRARYPGLRVVFMSGYSQENVERLGPLDAPLLAKPFTGPQLQQALSRALGE